MAVTTGVIADDFTGATDIASFMAEQGWRVALLPGMPEITQCWNEEVDAIVISLKSRALPAEQAVAQSLACARWLRQNAGVRQLYFKYCSTFDSTPAGNIGPVSDALMNDIQAPLIVHCPALPQNGRTVVHGHLFVNGVLLNESGMEKHPLNPMTDASVPRLLAAQTASPVGHIALNTIRSGVEAVTCALERYQIEGTRHVIVDTLDDTDLHTLAQALQEYPLLWHLISEPWLCALIALSLNSAAYTTQLFYGAIRAIPDGQWQSCGALGMSKKDTLAILLPYAFKRALSSYSNEVVLVFKSTSLAYTITLMEVMGHSQLLYGRTYDVMVFGAAGIVYLVVNGLLTLLMRLVEHKALAFERRN